MYAGSSTATRRASSSGTPRRSYVASRSWNASSSRPVISSGSCAIVACTGPANWSTVAWLSSGGRRLLTSQREARSTRVRIWIRIEVWTPASSWLS